MSHQAIKDLHRCCDALTARVAELEAALKKIEDWNPPQVISRAELVPMASALGSNGERDYFRQLASAALLAKETK